MIRLNDRLFNRLTKIHKELCRELGIHPARIIFDEEIDYLGTYSARHELIRINPKRIKDFGRRPEQTLAHETYHHYQCVRGWLTSTTWKGKNKRRIKLQLPWRQRPWERGAIRYAKIKAEENGWL